MLPYDVAYSPSTGQSTEHGFYPLPLIFTTLLWLHLGHLLIRIWTRRPLRLAFSPFPPPLMTVCRSTTFMPLPLPITTSIALVPCTHVGIRRRLIARFVHCFRSMIYATHCLRHQRHPWLVGESGGPHLLSSFGRVPRCLLRPRPIAPTARSCSAHREVAELATSAVEAVVGMGFRW